MGYCEHCGSYVNTSARALKSDVMGDWIAHEWAATRADQNLMTIISVEEMVNTRVLAKFSPDTTFASGYAYTGLRTLDCPVITPLSTMARHSGDLTYQTGAFVYTFRHESTGETVEVLVASSCYTDSGQIICLASVPQAFTTIWSAFSRECERIAYAREPEPRVTIIGGRSNSFVPTTDWDDIILPEDLKQDILDDVTSFFHGGIEVYKRLKLKPFRKLLLTGVPGTGKTMICSALAKWAIGQQYPVIYISSAGFGGSTFNKIEHALSVAANSRMPVMIILEELDAYLHEDEKAIVLNVLDGAESAINDYGTLLISTTNYPEAIDERVLKRPGRLDRIFVIPQVKGQHDAERMLKQYLGDMWRDDHRSIAQHLVGYPGAFIREVAVYALTQVIYQKSDELSLDILEKSFNALKAQIKARDDFLTDRTLGYRSA
jgi:hypothetical protein